VKATAEPAGSSFKRFGEEGAHGIPRPAAGICVVRKASVGQINPFKRERMHGMAVAMKLPISFSLREVPWRLPTPHQEARNDLPSREA
jgi:hypothetical protein